MRRAMLAACTLLVACAAPQLNSERIAERYGSYAVSIVRQDPSWRITSLESSDGGRRITRTLAVVRYADAHLPALAAVDRRIRTGASIGSSFRDAGWTVHKPLVYLGEIRVGSDAKGLAAMMDISLPATLAVHIYRFELHRNGRRYRYASIVELHHPDYLGIADLRALYGPAPAGTGAELLGELEAVLPTLPHDPGR